jgi:hypothetical protein
VGLAVAILIGFRPMLLSTLDGELALSAAIAVLAT